MARSMVEPGARRPTRPTPGATRSGLARPAKSGPRLLQDGRLAAGQSIVVALTGSGLKAGDQINRQRIFDIPASED